MRGLLLVSLLLAGCDGWRQSNSKGALGEGGDPGDDADDPVDDGTGGDEGADGGDGGGDDGSDGSDDVEPLEILLDRPAFYDESGTVEVTGRVLEPARLTRLTVAGVEVAVDGTGAFQSEVPLGSSPWDIARVVALDDEGNSHEALAQVAEAVPGTGTAPDGQSTLVGPEGRDELAALLEGFVEVDDFNPPAGTLLGSEVCDPCPPELECGMMTEAVSTDGGIAVEVQASLDTASGRLDLDLEGTRVSWGVTIDRVGYLTESIDTELELELGASTGAGSALSCQGLDLDVAIDPAPRSWSIGDAIYCLDVEDLGEQPPGLYEQYAGPGLDAASCAWADWLEEALACEIDGFDLDWEARAESAGLFLDWTADAVDASAPWQAPVRSLELEAAGIDVALADNLLGLVMDLAIRTGTPVEIQEGSDQGDLTLHLSDVAGDVATLAAISPTGQGLLVAPLAYTLEVDGVACEQGHLVPGPGEVLLTDAGDAWELSVGTVSAAGADVVGTCGLDESTRLALFDAGLEAVVADASVSWVAGAGLVDQGATLGWTASTHAFVVNLALP